MLKRFLSRSLAIGLGTLLVAAPAFAEISEKDFEDAMGRYLQTEKGREGIGQAMEKYVKEAQQRVQEAEFEEMMKAPVKIDVGSSPVKGPADAPITIIEFSDFECPFCKRGASTMDQILKKYPNEVKLAFKHLPLPMHHNAKPAAKATWAASKQGKFWEFHDALFENQAKLSEDFYIKTAESLKLDVEKFKKDMNSPEAEKQVQEDSELGNKYGIQGTPGFFVNGVAVKGAYPFEYFKKIIDRMLAEKK